MNDHDMHLLASRRTIYSLPGAGSHYAARRTRARRLRILFFVALAAAALYAFAYAMPGEAAGPLPPRRTMKPWPPAPPATYYCQPGNPKPPAWCWRYGQ